MDTTNVTLSREFICATCLSQDRKLFPVKDVKSVALFISVQLSEKDKLCWECHHFVRKVAAFRKQASKAQLLLKNALHDSSKATKMCSLSSLKTVSVESSQYAPDFLQVFVKAEPMTPEKEDKFEESLDKENDFSMDDEANDDVSDSLLPTELREAKGDEMFSDGMVNEVKVKKSIIQVKKAKTVKKRLKKVVKNQRESKKVQKAKEITPIDPENIFTVTIMDEEAMLKWREKKKKSEYYTSSDPSMRCNLCIEPFNCRKVSTAHARRHNEVYGPCACHICGVRVDTEKALGAHTEQHYRLLTCTACGFQWDSANTLRQHCADQHGVPVALWDCHQCGRQFPSQRQQSAHMICHRVVSCRDCGRLVRQNNIKKHKMLHEGMIPLRCCAVCGGQYRGDEGLATHMKTHDATVDKAAFCVECNIQFRTMQLYRNHRLYTVKHARAEDMQHKCSVCGKAFLQRAMLKLHVDGVHSREPRYRCGVCEEMFKTRVAKRKHERCKHEGMPPARNKICDICGKAFSNKSILLQHINKHTGARPFSCSHCDATFGYKSALYLHKRFKHKMNKKKTKRADKEGTEEEKDS